MEGYVVHNALTGTHVQLPYPSDVGGAILNGHAFHHGRFVMGLRKLAKEEKWYVCVCVCARMCVCVCVCVCCVHREQAVSMSVMQCSNDCCYL